ncbi:hypothetical protein V5O48_013206 [Marasmius crinis-equi]|uniref:Uncharacterized protein n=1 Tax=Marasmius crinis-equi TaxID=585013 RepID=A0ABR3F0Q9_9AGAR
MFFNKSAILATLSFAILFSGQAAALGDPVTACQGHKAFDKCSYLYLDGDVVREFNGFCVDDDGTLKCEKIRDPPKN